VRSFIIYGQDNIKSHAVVTACILVEALNSRPSLRSGHLLRNWSKHEQNIPVCKQFQDTDCAHLHINCAYFLSQLICIQGAVLELQSDFYEFAQEFIARHTSCALQWIEWDQVARVSPCWVPVTKVQSSVEYYCRLNWRPTPTREPDVFR
jgi:hypothetical protein